MIIGITSVDVIICAVWTGVDPLSWARTITSVDIFGQSLSSVGYCTSNNWKVFVSAIGTWHLILMLLACYLCYLTRNISSKFAGTLLFIVLFRLWLSTHICFLTDLFSSFGDFPIMSKKREQIPCDCYDLQPADFCH